MTFRGGWRAAVLCVVLALLAFGFISPIFKNIGNTGVDDWDQFCFFDEVPRETLLRYGQFPLWNPYYSGGRPLLANPQVSFLKPTFVFTLVFGCVIGLKIEALFMLLLGMVGIWLLSRHYRWSTIAGLLSAAIFGLCSYFSLHIADGQVSFFPFVLVPYVFLFLLKSFDNRKHLIFAAMFVAWMFFAGGAVHVVTPLVIFLLVYSSVRAGQEHSWKPLVHVAFLLLLAFGLAAVKTVPTLAYVAQNPRLTNLSEVMYSATIFSSLVAREQQLGQLHDIQERWQDYGAYIGVIPLLLFLGGAWVFRKKEAALLVAGLAAVAIALGNIAPFAPWPLLHQLPLFQSMHVPSRFMILFVFAAALIAGRMFDMLEHRFKKTLFARRALLVLAIIAIADLFVVGQQPFAQAFPNAPLVAEHQDAFQQRFETQIYRAGAYSTMYYFVRENAGMANGYDPVPQVTSVQWVGHPRYRGEAYLVHEGTASYSLWSPNKLVVRIATEQPSRLVLNQNYDAGWRAADGKQVEPYKGLLSVAVEPQDTTVTLQYIPITFFTGAFVSVLTLVGLLFFVRGARKEAVACWLVASVLVMLIIIHLGNQYTPPVTLDDCPPGNVCKSCSVVEDKETCVYGNCTAQGVCRIELWKAVPHVRNLSGAQ